MAGAVPLALGARVTPGAIHSAWAARAAAGAIPSARAAARVRSRAAVHFEYLGQSGTSVQDCYGVHGGASAARRRAGSVRAQSNLNAHSWPHAPDARHARCLVSPAPSTSKDGFSCATQQAILIRSALRGTGVA